MLLAVMISEEYDITLRLYEPCIHARSPEPITSVLTCTKVLLPSLMSNEQCIALRLMGIERGGSVYVFYPSWRRSAWPGRAGMLHYASTPFDSRHNRGPNQKSKTEKLRVSVIKYAAMQWSAVPVQTRNMQCKMQLVYQTNGKVKDLHD